MKNAVPRITYWQTFELSSCDCSRLSLYSDLATLDASSTLDSRLVSVVRCSDSLLYCRDSISLLRLALCSSSSRCSTSSLSCSSESSTLPPSSVSAQFCSASSSCSPSRTPSSNDSSRRNLKKQPEIFKVHRASYKNLTHISNCLQVDRWTDSRHRHVS